jgi:hypothetical protein
MLDDRSHLTYWSLTNGQILPEIFWVALYEYEDDISPVSLSHIWLYSLSQDMPAVPGAELFGAVT